MKDAQSTLILFNSFLIIHFFVSKLYEREYYMCAYVRIQ